MNEASVIGITHRFLKTQTIWPETTFSLYTDAHPSLLSLAELQPFQRFTVDLGDFVVHPDLVGQIGDGSTIFAVEAKGDGDLLKGIAQAELYQLGFHYSFLAADAAVLGNTIVELAKRKNIGILAVTEEVHVVHVPQAVTPMRRVYEFIARQMDTVLQVAKGQAFYYNIPTHYLVWAIALRSGVEYSQRECPELVSSYPMPKDWRPALTGAQRLGIVRIQGNSVSLTEVGTAVKDIMPATLEKWAVVHGVVGSRGGAIPLMDHCPQVAAVLRILLFHDPMVRLIVAGLKEFPEKSATFAELARKCDQIDHARAPIFFLRPESLPNITDDCGHILWNQVSPGDYRSTNFYQFKSIMKHAGILAPTRLGGASTENFVSSQDVWTLR